MKLYKVGGVPLRPVVQDAGHTEGLVLEIVRKDVRDRGCHQSGSEPTKHMPRVFLD